MRGCCSEADVEKMSWGHWAHSTADACRPAYSEKSFGKALQSSEQSLKNAGHEVMTAPIGPLAPLGVGPSAKAFEVHSRWLEHTSTD